MAHSDSESGVSSKPRKSDSLLRWCSLPHCLAPSTTLVEHEGRGVQLCAEHAAGYHRGHIGEWIAEFEPDLRGLSISNYRGITSLEVPNNIEARWAAIAQEPSPIFGTGFLDERRVMFIYSNAIGVADLEASAETLYRHLQLDFLASRLGTVPTPDEFFAWRSQSAWLRLAFGEFNRSKRAIKRRELGLTRGKPLTVCVGSTKRISDGREVRVPPECGGVVCHDSDNGSSHGLIYKLWCDDCNAGRNGRRAQRAVA
jgi:hypothetical protein